MDDLIGKQFGQYTIVGELGKGGMASVYRAQQASLGRDVALKVLPLVSSMLEDDLVERFNREVQIIAELQHPHILPVYDYGVQDGQPYIVMALMEGGTLDDLIREKAPMDLNVVLHILRQVTAALDFAHQQGVVHRDLKPTNILIDAHKRPNCYLADFGLAMMTGMDRITMTGAVLGTPAYMAPDWASQGTEITSSIDVYALGVIAFEMLTGEIPYSAPNPMSMLMMHMAEPIPDVRRLRPDLPIHISVVLLQAMAKQPQDRYATPSAFIEEFEKAVTHESQTHYTPLLKPMANAYYYPNLWGRTVLTSAEQVIGRDELDALLIQAELAEYIEDYPPPNLKKQFPFEHLGRLTRAIAEVYGQRGLQSIGRAAGWHTVSLTVGPDAADKYRGMLKVGNAILERTPIGKRPRVILEFYQRIFNGISDQVVELDETDDYFIWRVTRCPMCWGVEFSEPVGYLAVGTLQGMLHYGTGIEPRVSEVACIAKGDVCGEWFIAKADLSSNE